MKNHRLTIGILFSSILLLAGPYGALADSGEGISPAFVVNTLQLTPVVAEGISPAFVINTLQLAPVVGEGQSDAFVIDTRATSQQIIQYLLGLNNLRPAQVEFNGDGIVDIADVLGAINAGR